MQSPFGVASTPSLPDNQGGDAGRDEWAAMLSRLPGLSAPGVQDIGTPTVAGLTASPHTPPHNS